MRKHRWYAGLFSFLSALILLSCSSSDSPTQPTKKLPDITSFTALPTDIVPGDSVTLSYSIRNATQAKLYPGGAVLPSAVSGSIKVGPATPTLYALVATNADGKDSAAAVVTMSTVVPSITSFDLTVDTVLIGDSTQLTWQAVRADSIVVDNSVGKLPSATSGTTGYLKPTTNTFYRAIAYNQYGTDTATVRARVEVPATLSLSNGTLPYKGTLGSATYVPLLKYNVRDAQSQLLLKPWVKFQRISGDGSILVDSVKPNGVGDVVPTFTMSDSLGYAVLRAILPGVDSIDVALRASTVTMNKLTPQAQYVLCGDSLGMVKALNGNPERIDVDPNVFQTYAVYENSLHLVFTIKDLNQDDLAQNGEPVTTIIITQGYAGKSRDNIGIGSLIADVQAIYGSPDVVQLVTDSTPFVYKYRWTQEGLEFWTTSTAERTIFEIHLSPMATPASPANRPYAYPSPDLLQRPVGQEKAR